MKNNLKLFIMKVNMNVFRTKITLQTRNILDKYQWEVISNLKILQKTFPARDTLAKKPQNDKICLGKEPDVTPSQNLRLMKRLTNTIDRKIRQITPSMPDLEVVKQTNDTANYQQKLKSKEKLAPRVRKCPDPTLYEDIIESSSMHLNEKPTAKSTTPELNPDIRTPFENVQKSLFSFFTAVVPWCLMKRVYWKRDKRSEELYERTTRMNAKNRKISEKNHGVNLDI